MFFDSSTLIKQEAWTKIDPASIVFTTCIMTGGIARILDALESYTAALEKRSVVLKFWKRLERVSEEAFDRHHFRDPKKNKAFQFCVSLRWNGTKTLVKIFACGKVQIMGLNSDDAFDRLIADLNRLFEEVFAEEESGDFLPLARHEELVNIQMSTMSVVAKLSGDCVVSLPSLRQRLLDLESEDFTVAFDAGRHHALILKHRSGSVLAYRTGKLCVSAKDVECMRVMLEFIEMHF